ncbi:hypothetical protein GCM10027447_12320 [Glycomyces halotolerans]
METLLYAAAAIVALGAAATVLWKLGRGVVRLLRQVRTFLEDWNGEPERPGVPARPGVLERLERLDAQVHPNSGSSLRDAVDETRQLLRGHIADPDAHR